MHSSILFSLWYITRIFFLKNQGNKAVQGVDYVSIDVENYFVPVEM